MESQNQKQIKLKSDNKNKELRTFDREKIKQIKFPDITLIEEHDKIELDLNWKIPECLVIKYSNNDSQIAAGYTDGHIIIYDLSNQDVLNKVIN